MVKLLEYDNIQSLCRKTSLSQETHAGLFRGEVLGYLQLTFKRFGERNTNMFLCFML